MRSRAASALLCALIPAYSCAPSAVNRTIDDLQGVVDQATLIIDIHGSTAAANLQDKQEQAKALLFAKSASRAAWLSVSESNSKDSVSQKNERIASFFSEVPIPSLDAEANGNVKAGEEQLVSAIQLLLGQLQSNQSAIAANPRTGDAVPSSIPQSLTSHLNQIRQRAIGNISAADLAIQRLQR